MRGPKVGMASLAKKTFLQYYTPFGCQHEVVGADVKAGMQIVALD